MIFMLIHIFNDFWRNKGRKIILLHLNYQIKNYFLRTFKTAESGYTKLLKYSWMLMNYLLAAVELNTPKASKPRSLNITAVITYLWHLMLDLWVTLTSNKSGWNPKLWSRMLLCNMRANRKSCTERTSACYQRRARNRKCSYVSRYKVDK